MELHRVCDDIITSEPVLFLVSISGENQNSKGYTYPYIHSSRPGFDPWFGNISWRKKWQPTPVFLPGKSHGWWSLVGYHPWVAKSWTRLSDFRTQKQPKCSLTDEWIKKMWSVYTAEYCSAIKNAEIMPFAATWMDL